MFNDNAWATIVKNAYGLRSERREGVLLFHTRRGPEMNIVGDYIPLPSDDFFKKVRGAIRTDERPKYWHCVCNLETYRLKVNKPFDRLMMEDVHQKSRNLVNKAMKAGVQTEIVHDESWLKVYYRLYVKTMLRIGSIPQSYALFSEMWNTFGEGRMKIFLSRHNGRVVSGVIALVDKENKRLHIWSNAQSDEARAVSANMATYAAVLQFACESKETDEVDFGNSEPDSSLAFFKSRFGASKVGIWSCSSEMSNGGSVPTWPAKILSILPLPCVSLCSRFLFRYFR